MRSAVTTAPSRTLDAYLGHTSRLRANGVTLVFTVLDDPDELAYWDYATATLHLAADADAEDHEWVVAQFINEALHGESHARPAERYLHAVPPLPC